MLAKEAVEKYQELYHKRFGKYMGKEEAYEQGVKLIQLIKLIYKPIPKQEYGNSQKRREVQN